ncbi:Disease resistance protein L6 [Linum perenne]
MDQQRWPSIWPLAALSLAVAVFFLPKKRPGISKGTSPSSSQSKSPAENPISAPSSSSKYSLPVEYEVFLSFRGPDVRTTFADVLYKFLDRFKIRTFLDDEELRKGEKIAPSLTEAIKESKVYIPILSQGYASSKWCLQELALMVKWCKQGDDRIILPIFYMMEPRNVRHQEGSYKEAFRLHSKKYDAETIKEWKEALKEVGEMKGWSVKESDKQGDIIEKVYSKVWSHLLRSYKLVTDELVGIDSHVQQVTRLLTSDSEGMKVVGIHGMGGMGKTTIAKAVYNELYSQFDRFCFVEDAREILSKSEGIVALQSKIISSILRTDYKVTDASEGLHVIKDRVCKHKVLVVLDDVNNLFEFDQILGKLDNFSRESRFIVTTRDKRVLEVLQECKFYEPGEMSNDHALQLFSKHAFGTDNPPEEDASVSMEFVKVAAGLPLALKVIGSLLFRRERKFWAAKLMELKDIPPAKLQERLKVSYNELSDNEKQIFLDIACFFIGIEKDFPFYMWSDCKFYPESGINTLLLRSLIRFNERNQLWMHDHIRDLGRAIVREEDSQRPWKRSRIWSNKDALNILKTGEGSNWVEFLSVDMKDEILELTDTEFKKLSGLRYLEVHNGILIGDFKGVLPNLRWLRLQHCRSIPSDLNMKKLVILEMERCPVEDEWRGWSGTKVASNLKAIHLHYCHETRTAPDLSQCRNLEWIDLEGCLGMSGEIHIGNLLKNLKLLRFSETNITKLTGEIGTLENLQVLDAGNRLEILPNFANLNNLTKLSLWKFEVPEIQGLGDLIMLETCLNKLTLSSSTRVLNLSELKDLEELCFDDCDKLQYLGGLWKLSKLRKLVLKYLSSCNSLLVEGEDPSSLNSLQISGLEILPNFANLNNLTELALEEFQVPEIQGLGDLIMLETLWIDSAQNLINLDGLECLSHLNELWLKDCCVLEKLPVSLANLTKLQRLTIEKCTQLAEVMSVERLEALSELSMADCTSITKLPDLSALANLRELDISGCTGLTGVMVIPRLELLTKLSMSGCSSVEELTDLSGLRNMVRLDISVCNKLKEVTGIEGFEVLEFIGMAGCTSIKKLSDLSGCKKLRLLDIRGCVQLAEFTGIENLELLEDLEMRNCTSITKLSDLSVLTNLKRLTISGCTGLTEIMVIQRLEWLEHLYMSGCSSVEELPDLSGLRNIVSLDISGCVQLADVMGVGRLESLKSLVMSGCSSVEDLPDFSGLRNMASLDIKECNQLEEITGIESLELLKYLVMRNCTSIKKLPDLSGCKKLRRLDIRGCVQLAEVGGIERLESLKWLNISECNQLKEVTGIGSLELLEELVMRNCTSIKKLPDLSGCKELHLLDIRGCIQLAEVSGIDKLVGLKVFR